MRLVPVTRAWVEKNVKACVAHHSDPRDPWTEDNFLEELPRKYELSFAAYEGTELLLVAIASQKAEDECRLHLLVTVSHRRGTTVGTSFWEPWLAELRKMGVKHLTWKVHRESERAMNFYRKVVAPDEEVIESDTHVFFSKRL